jgi:hypothetical protein
METTLKKLLIKIIPRVIILGLGAELVWSIYRKKESMGRVSYRELTLRRPVLMVLV